MLWLVIWRASCPLRLFFPARDRSTSAWAALIADLAGRCRRFRRADEALGEPITPLCSRAPRKSST